MRMLLFHRDRRLLSVMVCHWFCCKVENWDALGSAPYWFPGRCVSFSVQVSPAVAAIRCYQVRIVKRTYERTNERNTKVTNPVGGGALTITAPSPQYDVSPSVGDTGICRLRVPHARIPRTLSFMNGWGFPTRQIAGCGSPHYVTWECRDTCTVVAIHFGRWRC
jgi:hypothetical protein